MTQAQFNEWLRQLSRRMPDTADWLASKDGVAAFWFEAIFADLDYDICVSALDQLWQEGVKAYDRERLPATIAKRCQEINYRRQQSAQRAAERRQRNGSGFYDSARGDVKDMRACMDQANIIRDALKTDECRWTKPKSCACPKCIQREAFIDQWFESATPVRSGQKWLDQIAT